MSAEGLDEAQEANTIRKYGATTTIYVDKLDKTGNIGKTFAGVGRELGNTITTTIAQDRGNYVVDILVTLRKVHELA